MMITDSHLTRILKKPGTNNSKYFLVKKNVGLLDNKKYNKRNTVSVKYSINNFYTELFLCNWISNY